MGPSLVTSLIQKSIWWMCVSQVLMSWCSIFCCCDPCLSVSSVKQQITTTAFKWVTFAVVLQLYPGFVCVRFACTWLKGVQILVKHPLRRGGHKFLGGGINFGRGINSIAFGKAPRRG